MRPRIPFFSTDAALVACVWSLFLHATLSSLSAVPTAAPRNLLEVRSLSRTQTEKSTNTIQIEAVVTLSYPRWSLCFVDDSTAGIYIFGPAIPDDLVTGERIRITGIPAPGKFAPVLNVRELKRLGTGPIPLPKRPEPDRLLTGGEDSQWIVMEGTVLHSTQTDGTVWNVSSATGPFEVQFTGIATAAPDQPWVGSQVRVRGVCVTSINPHGQFQGYRLITRDSRDVEIIRPARADPFDLETTPLQRVMEFNAAGEPERRVRVQGTVTWSDFRRAFQIQEGGHGIETSSPPGATLPTLGDEIDVVGFASAGRLGPVVQYAQWRLRGKGQVPAPNWVDLRRINPDQNGLLVTVEATLREVFPSEDGTELRLRDSAGRMVSATIPSPRGAVDLASFEPGARVRLTGVYRVASARDEEPASHLIHARGPGDLTMIGGGAWWTTRRATQLALTMALLTAGGLAWTLLVRRRLARQRGELETQHAKRLALEQIHRRLTEGAPDAIFTIDPKGIILSANPASTTFSGYSEAELKGMSIFELLPTPDRDSLAAKLALRFAPDHAASDTWGDEDPFQVEIIDRQRRRRTMEVTSRVLSGPTGEKYLEGMARDITERKRAEEALKTLASTATPGGGEEFLRFLARQIGELLGVQQVFIATINDSDTRSLHVPVLFCQGAFLPNRRFERSGTPWDNPENGKERVVTRDARARFPQDAYLDRWKTESAVGIPLRDQAGETFGLLGLLHDRPFEPSTTQLDMLRVLASRVGSEFVHQRASEALQASEERFRQLAEESEDVLWVIDLPSRQLAYLGPSFARIAGLSADSPPRTLREVLRLVLPADRRKLVAAARAGLARSETRYSTEFRIVRPDRSCRWILDQGVLIRNAEGQAIRLSGVARDITARKSAEIALAAERARFQDLFENSPDAIFVESLEGIILDVNVAACQLHDLPRERLIGCHFSDLIPPSARADARRVFERIRQGESGPLESLSLRSDGERIPIEFRAKRIRHHEVEALLFHVRDITARRQSAEFMAGQMRILEGIATARPLEDLLSELVQMVEARAFGSQAWIQWWNVADPKSMTVVAPSIPPEIQAQLASMDGLPPAGTTPREGFFAGSISVPKELRTGTIADSPIIAPSGRHLGILAVHHPGDGTHTNAVTDAHRLAASLAGIAIEREVYDAALRSGADQLRMANAELLVLARSEAVSQGDLGLALREIAAAAAQSLRVGRVSVWIFEDADTLLRCVHLLDDLNSSTGAPQEIGVGTFPSYFTAVSHERLVAIGDTENDSRARELLGRHLHPVGVTATIDAGIRLRGKLVGLVCFEHRGGRRPWKTEEELIAGSIADIVAMALQASERRCIEEALRQSEEAYRSVVGALAEGVMLINSDGTFLTFNESAAEILGFSQAQIAQRKLADFEDLTFTVGGVPLAPEDYPAAITLRTGEPITDSLMEVRRTDGRSVYLSINSRPFGRDETGRITSVVTSFTDISRRLEAERALREGNELLQAISGVQAGFIADGDAARTLDLMLSNLIGMTSSEHGVVAQIGPDRRPEGFRLFFPDPAAVVQPNLAHEVWGPLVLKVLDSGRAERALTTHHPTADETASSPESARSTELLALPLRHDETVVGLIGLARPAPGYTAETVERLQPLLITCANLLRAMDTDRQRQQAEAQIRQLNAELEQRVELRTADLRAMNQELAEFAYVVTHDLKAPLRGIHQLSEWLAHDHATQLDAGGLRLLALLRQRVLHLQRLIDGLLACARVGRSPEPERTVATLELVRQVVVVIAPPTHISFQIANDLPAIEGNPDRLHQIFQNLIDNAVKYLDKPRGRIAVSALRERGAWVFRVADNGPGIPERYRDKVFQIFQRLHQTGDIPGTGLGLTLVKRIVEARGGRIWIESEGIGTTVCFTWPDKGRPRTVGWDTNSLPSRVSQSQPDGPTSS